MGVMGIEQKPWSYAEKAKVRELWETHSASHISARLSGRTRNAVISLAHRMGLPPKRFRSGNKTKSAPKRAVTQKLRTSGVTNQRPTSLSDKHVGAIQFQSGNSSRCSGNAGGELLPVACTHSNPRGSEGLGVPGREATVNSRAADAGAGEISPFAPLAPVALLACSSTVEQSAVNRLVAGSNPAMSAIPVPLLELTARSCRYIVEGEGEYALFCNAPRLEHGPYCPSHAARCYTAPERRRVT